MLGLAAIGLMLGGLAIFGALAVTSDGSPTPESPTAPYEL